VAFDFGPIVPPSAEAAGRVAVADRVFDEVCAGGPPITMETFYRPAGSVKQGRILPIALRSSRQGRDTHAAKVAAVHR
jgi:hypothetical protein